MSTEIPNFKKFVSEDEIEEAKRKRQEEWEKVRQPDQPEEAPEEEYDPRSLFERLEANKTKKQEEYDESHRLKNMVRGLENDEIDFLEFVSRQKEQEEQEKVIEEKLLLAEYKSSLVYDRTKDVDVPAAIEKLPAKSLSSNKSGSISQKSLLAGVIKKKRQPSETTDSVPAKAAKLDSRANDDSTKVPKTSSQNIPLNVTATASAVTTTTSLLPGIGDYADSDSDTE